MCVFSNTVQPRIILLDSKIVENLTLVETFRIITFLQSIGKTPIVENIPLHFCEGLLHFKLAFYYLLYIPETIKITFLIIQSLLEHT